MASPQAIAQEPDHHLTESPPPKKQDDGAAAQAGCEMGAVTQQEEAGQTGFGGWTTVARGYLPPLTHYFLAQEAISDIGWSRGSATCLRIRLIREHLHRQMLDTEI